MIAPLALALSLSLVAALVLTPIMRSPGSGNASLPTAKLQVLQAIAPRIPIQSTFNSVSMAMAMPNANNQVRFPIVRVTDARGFGVEGVNVNAHLVSVRAKYGSAEAAPVHVRCESNPDLFDAFLYDVFCARSPRDLFGGLRGGFAVTDRDGFAVFPEFAVRRVIPGEITVAFVAAATSTAKSDDDDSANGNGDDMDKNDKPLSVVPLARAGSPLRVDMHFEATSDVAFLAVSSADVPAAVEIGVPLPSFTINVSNFDGSAAAGRQVTAVAFPLARGSPRLAHGSMEDVRSPRAAVLSNAVSTTDEQGQAQFNTLTVAASSFDSVYLLLVCERAVAFFFPQQPRFVQPTKVTTSVATVEIVVAPAASVKEGILLAQQPAVRLTDSLGLPLIGKRATAHITFRAGYRAPPFALNGMLDGRLVFADKELNGAISEPSGSDGIARFARLGFSSNGEVGQFRVRFYADGIASAESTNISVTTSVAHVYSLWSPFSGAADGTISLSVGVEIQPLPAALVVDAHGDPLPGKVAKIELASGNTATFLSLARPSEESGLVEFYYVLPLAPLPPTDVHLVVDGVRSAPVRISIDPNLSALTACSTVKLDGLPSSTTVGEIFSAVVSVKQFSATGNSSGNSVAGALVGGVVLPKYGGSLSLGATSTGLTGLTGSATVYGSFSYGFSGRQPLLGYAYTNGTVTGEPDCLSPLYFVDLVQPARFAELVTPLPLDTQLAGKSFTVEYVLRSDANRVVPFRATTMAVFLNLESSTPQDYPSGITSLSATLGSPSNSGNLALNVSISEQFPGNHTIISDISGIPGPLLDIQVASVVSSLELLVPPTGVNFGVFQAQPRIRVHSTVANVTVHGVRLLARLVDMSGGVVDQRKGMIGNFNSDYFQPYAISEPSDMLGVANFIDLGCFGARPGNYTVEFVFALGTEYETSVIGGTVYVDAQVVASVSIQPSATFVDGLLLASAPAITATASSLGADQPQLHYFPCFARVISESLSDGFEPTGSGTTAFARGDGVAVFSSLLIRDMKAGASVHLEFFVPGMARGSGPQGGVLSTSIVESRTPSAIIIKQQPPSVVYMGLPFTTSAVVRHESGSPLPGLLVQLNVLPEDGITGDLEPILLDSVSGNVSTQSGDVVVRTVVQFAIPGRAYMIRFSIPRFGVISSPSTSFMVASAVSSVSTPAPPTITDEKVSGILISDNISSDLSSIEQNPAARVNLKDAFGRPVAGRQGRLFVIPANVEQSNDTLWTMIETESLSVEFKSGFSSNDGVLEFTSVRLRDGPSGTYRFIVVVEGIPSEPSAEFEVVNLNRPDFANLATFQVLVYILMLTSIPMLFVNSIWISKKGIFTGCVACSLVLLLLLSVVTIGLMVSSAAASNDPAYPVLVQTPALVVNILCFALLLFVSVQWYRGKQSSFSSARRREQYLRHVQLLFRARRPEYVTAYATFGDGVDTSNMHHKAAFRFYCKRAASMLRGLFWSPPNTHDYLEFRWNVFWGQRLLIATMLSAVAHFLTFVACLLTIQYVLFSLKNLWNSLLEKAVDLSRGRSDVINQGALSDDVPSSIIATVASPFEDAYSHLVSVLVLKVASAGTTLLNDLDQRIYESGVAAIIVALLLSVMLWASIFVTFRRAIYDVRWGKYSGPPKGYFSAAKASNYVGLQVVHAVLWMFAVFVLLWVLFFIFAFGMVRQALWQQTQSLIVTSLSATLVISVLRILLMLVLVDGFDFRHRRWYGLADFFNTFAGIVSAVSQTLIRFVVGLISMVLFFIRLDIPVMGLEVASRFDPGFASWQGMLFTEAYYGNPTMNFFVQLMLENYVKSGSEKDRNITLWRSDEEKVRRAALAENSSSDVVPTNAIQQQVLFAQRRARNRWHLAVLLIRNPSLRAYRVHGPSNINSCSVKFNTEHNDIEVELANCFVDTDDSDDDIDDLIDINNANSLKVV